MLYANPSDCKKIEDKVVQILSSTTSDKIIVDFMDFYEDCKLQELRRIKFADEVSDILCGSKFCKRHGLWLFTDYDGGYTMFIRVAAAHRPSTREALLACGILTEYKFEQDTIEE